MEGKRVVTMFDYYEKREHSLLVLEYLQVGMAKELFFPNLSFFREESFSQKWARQFMI